MRVIASTPGGAPDFNPPRYWVPEIGLWDLPFDHSGWAQINVDPANGAIGTIGPEGAGGYSTLDDWRTMPDLAVDHDNCMAVGYTKTNPNMFPAVFVNGRTTSDPPRMLQTEVQQKAREVPYVDFTGPPHRWGDYSGMTIDPDGQTFWYLGEYAKNLGASPANWGTWIANYD